MRRIHVFSINMLRLNRPFEKIYHSSTYVGELIIPIRRIFTCVTYYVHDRIIILINRRWGIEDTRYSIIKIPADKRHKYIRWYMDDKYKRKINEYECN